MFINGVEEKPLSKSKDTYRTKLKTVHLSEEISARLQVRIASLLNDRGYRALCFRRDGDFEATMIFEDPECNIGSIIMKEKIQRPVPKNINNLLFDQFFEQFAAKYNSLNKKHK